MNCPYGFAQCRDFRRIRCQVNRLGVRDLLNPYKRVIGELESDFTETGCVHHDNSDTIGSTVCFRKDGLRLNVFASPLNVDLIGARFQFRVRVGSVLKDDLNTKGFSSERYLHPCSLIDRIDMHEITLRVVPRAAEAIEAADLLQ